MFKIELDVVHKGCWGSEISLKFPSIKFFSIDCRWVKGQVAHILFASGDSKYFNRIIKYLRTRKDVSSMEILSRDKTKLYIRTVTQHNKKYTQFSYIFFKNNCFPIAPTKFEHGFEIWTLGTANKRNFTKIYNSLKKKYKMKIKYLKEEPIETKLTNKQREILMYAKHFGYYEWPRHKSVSEICKLIKIPKTVFLSHLRKAENKIIKNHFSSE